MNDLLIKYPEVYQILTEYLKKKKLRITSERYFLLFNIYELNCHFDVNMLFSSINNSDLKISLATIYNSLDIFVESGLIIKHNSKSNVSVYEKSFGIKQHDHFFCKICGKSIEFCEPRINKLKKDLEEVLKVKIDNHSLYLYGNCVDLNCKNLESI